MGAAQSAHSVNLAVLVEFEDVKDASDFMGAELPKRADKIGLRSALQDCDIVRMDIRVDGASPGLLRSIKRAIVGHSTGRAFVKDSQGVYRAWNSKKLARDLIAPDASSRPG
eukprot:jgi/Tetstr1/464063/TSEL_008868.t1